MLALGALGLALLGVFLMRATGRGTDARQQGESSEPAPTAVPAGPQPSSSTRNVFEYAGGPDRPLGLFPPAPAAPLPASASVAPEPPVRLVGLLRRGGRMRAALSVAGEVVIVGHGEEAGGYRVLSIDDDRGVRLRGPGGEFTLPPPDAP